MKTLLLFLLLTSCTTISKSPTINHNPLFNKYKLEFQQFTGIDTEFVKISFIQKFKSKRVAGKCYVYNNYKHNYIEISKEYYLHSDSQSRKALLFHELGHCAAKFYKHKSGKMKDGCPLSLMNRSMPNYFCLQKNWTYYKLELSVLLQGE